MKRAAFGICMHSGWGVLVAVNDAAEIIDRRRIIVTRREGFRGKQPFHHAKELSLAKAETFLASYTAECDRLACDEIRAAISDCEAQGHHISAAAILLTSARKLPALAQILASHALIHAAEGKFFRDIAQSACEFLGIPTTGYSKRELEQDASAAVGAVGVNIAQRLTSAGKSLGPPWTADHKSAAKAAYLTIIAKPLAKTKASRC